MTSRARIGMGCLALAVVWAAACRPCLAAEPAVANSLLARTEHLVSGLLDQVSDVKCTERVLQEKLGKNGKVEYKEASTYDYLVILTVVGGDLTLNESRVPQEHSDHKKPVSLLVTNGFGMGFLIFHPYYSASFDFHDDGEQVVDGKLLRKIHFRHIRGTRTPVALSLRGREYPLELEGDAWVDPASGAIARMDTTIPAGIDDLGLRSLRSQVEYAPVSFPGAGPALWLPLVAAIEVETPRQHWRNTHRFSDYRRFSVSTEETVKDENLGKK